MQDLNHVQLIGHVGHDPEVTYTATGTARTTFSVATSQRWKDVDGQEQEATEWSWCVAWDTLAEVCAQSVTKGSRVYVAGRLHTVRWEDAQTGERHARVEIVLDDLILLDRRGGASVAATDDADSMPWVAQTRRGGATRRPRRTTKP
jgi:single-strand DNA-binding protein